MRQPLDSGSILISRSNCHVTYPAKFQLIAAMNPCRCGYLSDPTRSCNRAPKCAIDYIAKISGPILDRIDIHVEVPAVTPLELEQADNNNESSAIVSARIKQARITQSKRYEGYNIRTNSELDGTLLIENAFPDDAGKELLNKPWLSYLFQCGPIIALCVLQEPLRICKWSRKSISTILPRR